MSHMPMALILARTVRRTCVVGVLAALLPLATHVGGLDAVAATPAEPASVVRRTTLVVADIEASIAFYRDVLDFETWLDQSGLVNEQSLPSAASPGDASRLVIMKGRDPWIGMIGLLQYGEATTPAGPPAILAPGATILMLETDDVAGIWQRIRAAGTPVLREPRQARVSGADGRQWNVTMLFAFDPDGHLLEINQPEFDEGEHPGGPAAELRQ